MDFLAHTYVVIYFLSKGGNKIESPHKIEMGRLGEARISLDIEKMLKMHRPHDLIESA